MTWDELRARVAYWHKFLGIPSTIRFVDKKEFNARSRVKLQRTDCGRCSKPLQIYTIKPIMRKRAVDTTCVHELLHLLYPLAGEAWVDNRAELIAGYKRQVAIETTRKRAKEWETKGGKVTLLKLIPRSDVGPGPVRLSAQKKGWETKLLTCSEEYRMRSHKLFCQGCSKFEVCVKAWDDRI